MTIDTSFDFRSDAVGRDPDSHSPTLRRYHQMLWSKALPCGTPFDLAVTKRGNYLYHSSALGEFSLSSDTAVPSLWHKAAKVVNELPAGELEAFHTIGYTIGAMMVFPGNRVNRKMTINGARGFHPRIADRLDLTVECIRRHYRGEASPLAAPLERYGDFFRLFGDFQGYVDFFLLQDLVSSDHSTVKFFMPFEDFKSSAVPKDIDTYQEFRRLSIDFIKARNRRMDALSFDSMAA